MNRGLSATPGVHGSPVINAWRELGRRYARDKDAIEATWQAMGRKEREDMVLESVLGGKDGIPRDENDRPAKFNSFFTPEMNLNNLVTGDNLLELISMRATTPIQNAYVADIDLVRDACRKHNFKLARAGNGVYQFMDEEKWGQLYEISPHAPRSVRQNLLDMGKGYAMVTEADGKFVLERQIKIYPHLQILADDIMEHKRSMENPNAGPAPRKNAIGNKMVAETLRKLETDKKGSASTQKRASNVKTSVEDLRSLPNEQYETIVDHLYLLQNQPQYLSNIAGYHYFYSASDVAIPDERGQADGQMMTGIYCTRVVKEAFGDAFEARGIWKSITTLVGALGDGASRDSPVTKELWSLCSKELNRTRLIFKRFLQADQKCVKFFVRQGSAIQLKVPLNVIEKKNKYLALLIAIARMEISNDMDMAIGKVLKEVHEMEEQVPKFRENISDHVGAALGDVAVITVFMARLRSFIFVPKQPTTLFVKNLDEQITGLKKAWESVDLQEYASPVDKLKDPGMAQACFGVLNDQCFESLGIMLDQLHDEIIGKSLCRVLESIEAAELQKLNRCFNLDVPFDPFVASMDENQPPTSGAHEKTKTRGQPAAEYLLQQRKPEKTKAPAPGDKITVRSNASKTLKKLFSSSSSASGVPWSAFLSVMTSLGFTSEPIWGSVFRFQHDTWGAINIHRPHPGDRFEGFATLRLRARLNRRFGWGNDTFVVEKK
ncbi:hypothetical protein K440DRAFT_615313 [Wilcoxina mikolae CBS 423.85]|nr:hypothetical protein K440DRAFT_615313 [Wilcoxina mikolae CBS 423.85]